MIELSACECEIRTFSLWMHLQNQFSLLWCVIENRECNPDFDRHPTLSADLQTWRVGRKCGFLKTYDARASRNQSSESAGINISDQDIKGGVSQQWRLSKSRKLIMFATLLFSPRVTYRLLYDTPPPLQTSACSIGKSRQYRLWYKLVYLNPFSPFQNSPTMVLVS